MKRDHKASEQEWRTTPPLAKRDYLKEKRGVKVKPLLYGIGAVVGVLMGLHWMGLV